MSDPQVVSGLSPQGMAIASLGGMQLHSRFDPVKEATRIAGSPDIDSADLVVLFGFGLGYVPEALAARQADRPIIVVEPDPSWPDQAINLRSRGTLPFSLPEGFRMDLLQIGHADQLVAILQSANCRNPALISNPAQARLHPEQASLCQEAIHRFRERSRVNVNTLNKFGHLWVRNLARNLDLFAQAPGIASLADRCAGLPGLLLAGGPSLDEVTPHLAALRRKMVLVAVDTSLRACLRVGIDPDFVVMVDPQYWNTRHLDGCTASRAMVISESSVFPRSLRLTAGPVRFCSSLFPLGQFFEQRIGAKGPLGAGGSVATSAWDFLRHLGIREVFTAGLDLSFPSGQTHFKGSVFEEATHRDADRLHPAAMRRYAYLHGASSYPTPDDSGGQVLSDQRMDIYAHWFENQFRQHQDMVNRRIGHGSRQIAGLGNIDIAGCLELPDCRERIDGLLATFREEGRSVAVSTVPHSGLDIARRELCSQLRTLSDLVTEALGILDHPESGGGLLPQSFARLDAIDHELGQFANNRIIGFLVENLIQELSTAAPPADLAEALDRSSRLYDGLARACKYHLELFELDRTQVG